jgi:hypothetical protein
MAGAVGWLANWGNTVASAKRGSTTHFWIPATYAMVAVGAVGFLIILAVMFNWPSKLWRRVKRPKEPRQQLPDEQEGTAPSASQPQRDTGGTVSLRNFPIGGDSDLKVRSSADILADGGGLFDRAKFDAQHFPGHPELFNRVEGPQGEQEEAS